MIHADPADRLMTWQLISNAADTMPIPSSDTLTCITKHKVQNIQVLALEHISVKTVVAAIAM